GFRKRRSIRWLICIRSNGWAHPRMWHRLRFFSLRTIPHGSPELFWTLLAERSWSDRLESIAQSSARVSIAITRPISHVEPVPPADGALVPGPWQQLQAWKPLRVGPDAIPESRRTTVHDPDDAVGDTRGVNSGAITTDDDIERVLPRRFVRLGGLLGPVRRFPLFGEDCAGLDDRNRNPERLDLVAERLRISFECPFRRAIDGSEG